MEIVYHEVTNEPLPMKCWEQTTTCHLRQAQGYKTPSLCTSWGDQAEDPHVTRVLLKYRFLRALYLRPLEMSGSTFLPVPLKASVLPFQDCVI